MPIKEFVSWGFIVIAGIAITKGPQNIAFEMRKLQYQMLREIGHTSNWGNPSIFKHSRKGAKHEKEAILR